MYDITHHTFDQRVGIDSFVFNVIHVNIKASSMHLTLSRAFDIFVTIHISNFITNGDNLKATSAYAF